MFGRVTALHFSVFLPSLGEIVPLTATVNVDEHGDLTPGEVYRQGTGDEVPAKEKTRAVEHAMDACAMLQDRAVSGADPVAIALRTLLDVERAAHEASETVDVAARLAGLHWLDVSHRGYRHADLGRADGMTPGREAMERYVAHLAESAVPAAMLKKAEEAQERHVEEEAERYAEDRAHERAEYLADRAEGII
jgi:hypothetical protein